MSRVGLHKEPLSQICLYCNDPFPAFSDMALFCSNKHRTAYWKETRKRTALVDALMAFHQLAEAARALVAYAVSQAAERFYRYAAWLGLVYRTKKYEWVETRRTA